MSILISMDHSFATPLCKTIENLDPNRRVYIWPDVPDLNGITYALLWKHRYNTLHQLPQLELILSYGAGVDHILSDPDLPDCPIVRFVDPDLTQSMSEYICMQVLLHQRRFLDLYSQQKHKIWRSIPQYYAKDIRIGIMGLGVLGKDAALKLKALGFHVTGWARSRKHITGIDCFVGASEFDAFLGQTDILVCLLPLTDKTEGLLDRQLFQKLPRDGPLPGPVLINAGRGGLHVETDIIDALDNGTLYAASLDVFETEPLADSSPLWDHPRVIITPHNAADTTPYSFARYALRQITQYERGLPLENLVDLGRGY